MGLASVFRLILLGLLVVCAVAVNLTKNLLQAASGEAPVFRPFTQVSSSP